MILTKEEQAADVVIRLSNMMSYMLYECERDRIVLDKEIQNLNNYIELEKIRYGKRLDISFETGGVTNNQVIAPLLFMPFIENAFKHGVEKSRGNTHIHIKINTEGNQLRFSIENSYQKTETEHGQGIGLDNLKSRLQYLYPNRHELIIEQDESIFKVQLNLKII